MNIENPDDQQTPVNAQMETTLPTEPVSSPAEPASNPAEPVLNQTIPVYALGISRRFFNEDGTLIFTLNGISDLWRYFKNLLFDVPTEQAESFHNDLIEKKNNENSLIIILGNIITSFQPDVIAYNLEFFLQFKNAFVYFEQYVRSIINSNTVSNVAEYLNVCNSTIAKLDDLFQQSSAKAYKQKVFRFWYYCLAKQLTGDIVCCNAVLISNIQQQNNPPVDDSNENQQI